MPDLAPSRVNEQILDHAKRELVRLLAGAERGDAECQRAVIEAAHANILNACVKRLAAAADLCAPTREQIKTQPKAFSVDAIELRHATRAAQDALSAAAGCAVAGFEREGAA